jgi:hypothetical protein
LWAFLLFSKACIGFIIMMILPTHSVDAEEVCSMKGWLVIGACILGIAAFAGFLWIVGTYL